VEWRILHNEELHNLYIYPSIARIVAIMDWSVRLIWERRSPWENFVRKHLWEMMSFRRAQNRWDHVIRMGVRWLRYDLDFFHSSTALLGLASSCLKFLRWHSDTPHPVGLLWTSDRPCRRDLYLTTHNTHKRRTSMLPAGFEPVISASERPHTHALDHAATGWSGFNWIKSGFFSTLEFFTR
jgi:hypothetical protein